MKQHFSYKIVDSISEFRTLKETWNRLAGSVIFQRWEWMVSWWESFQERGKLFLILVETPDDGVVGIAPWFLSNQFGKGKVVQSLTAGETCSDYLSVLHHPDYCSEVAEVLSQLLCGGPIQLPEHRALFSSIDSIELEGHRQQDPIARRLMLAVEENGGWSDVYEIGATWKVSLPDQWDQFQKSVRSSFRRKVKKACKRLDSDEFEFRFTQGKSQLEEQWPEFVRLHQKRRNFLGEPGCFADPDFESFLRNAASRLAEQNLARINTILHKGKPIGTTLELLPSDEVWMYQSGIDIDALSLEPGHLVFAGSIRQAIADGRKTFDFLRGDEPYKAKWNTQRHLILKTTLVPNRVTSKCRYQVATAQMQTKKWIKSLIASCL